MNIGELKQRQSLPLEQKIKKSIQVIEKFYEDNDGDVYISKGGINSNTVQWLAQQSIYGKRIESVCVASVEPVENIKHNKEKGDLLLKSKHNKKDVIVKYGYPLISKEVAMKLSRYLRSKLDWAKERRLKGYMGRDGKWKYDSMIPKKYQVFIYAPFEFSEKCCDFTKKEPLKKYEKHTNKKPITGERAEDSNDRLRTYLKNGCISDSENRKKCTPTGFWTQQDELELYFRNMMHMSYPKIYGYIIKRLDGTYEFSGENRTGCEICAFGIMFDSERFERLKERKPNLYSEMMRGGRWIRKDLYRWVKFRPCSIPIWSNLYWVPSEIGFGYKFVLNYFYETMKIEKKV